VGIYSHQSGGVVETPEKRMENKQKKDMFRAQVALIVPIPGDPGTRYFLLMVVPAVHQLGASINCIAGLDSHQQW